MSLFRLFASFRVRLLLVLAALLLATLGVQYYLNLRTARANRLLREQQQQALWAGVAFGFRGRGVGGGGGLAFGHGSSPAS